MAASNPIRLQVLVLTLLSAAAAAGPLEDQFRDPPRDAAMTVYWIWFGPAVTRAEIDRDLDNMRRAGIGGTVLLPVYPLTEEGNLPFLSSEFLDILDYAARRHKELGLTFDVTAGTGWPYGGPWITPDLGARMIRIRAAADPLKPNEEIAARFGDRVVVSMPTGMRVKRPSIGDEGLVLDHYNRHALEKHLEVAGEKLWQAVRAAGIRSFWCDSLEVFQANWTPGFPERFQRLRGYDLKPLLPKLFGPPDDDARHVRHDFWRTLTELAQENFVRPLQEWCHSKGVDLQMESYGQPPVALGSFRYVDRPVGEHYEWRMFNASRWAASGGRLHGKNVIGAEAWTWTGIPNRFADSLEDLKLASDMHFVSGINALMGISYVHTPDAAGKPGWIPYWGPWINHNQTWWPYFPHFSRYLQRMSWLLRQGRPVVDLALYLPAGDAYANTPADKALNLYFAVRDLMHGKPAPEFGLRNAISGDTPVISTILSSGYSFDGIDYTTLDKAGSYKAVILPNLRGLPLEDLRTLAGYVRSGGHVIATERLPELAWGRNADQREFARLLRAVRPVLTSDLRATLHKLVPPDIGYEHPDPDIAFVHRRLPEAELYFIANLGYEEKSLQATFRARNAAVRIWNPMTGDTNGAWDGTLRLEPAGSTVVWIGRSAPPPAPPPPSTSHTISLDFGALSSWPEHFSGTRDYRAEFDLTAAPTRAVLDLGQVREVADVEVNGRGSGVVWKRPYRLDITRFLRSGHNSLRVRVTNLWINAVLARPQPDYSALNAKFGIRFPDPQEWKVATPLPSGLFGPARLHVAGGTSSANSR